MQNLTFENKSSKIIDGKKISDEIKAELKNEVKKLHSAGIFPGLAMILIGNNQASKIYIRNKKFACKKIGIYSEEHLLDENVTQEQVLQLIDNLNKNKKISGILVQLPVPPHIDVNVISESIDPLKDVDAFNLKNVGKIMVGNFSEKTLLPCTPAGIIELLKRTNIDICGKHAVIIGRSNIVGKPLALLLLHENATVTICHTKTQNLNEICKTADILISACGKPKLVTENMVKIGAIVVDVGINRLTNGKIQGDVDFENVLKKISKITPVPGGVGPMTIAMLMRNCVKNAKNIFENK